MRSRKLDIIRKIDTGKKFHHGIFSAYWNLIGTNDLPLSCIHSELLFNLEKLLHVLRDDVNSILPEEHSMIMLLEIHISRLCCVISGLFHAPHACCACFRHVHGVKHSSQKCSFFGLRVYRDWSGGASTEYRTKLLLNFKEWRPECTTAGRMRIEAWEVSRPPPSPCLLSVA